MNVKIDILLKVIPLRFQKEICMKYIFILLFFLLLLGSCVSVPKDITYFQDLDSSKLAALSGLDLSQSEPEIKDNDILLISVASPALQQEIVAQFNLPMSSYLMPGENRSTQYSGLQQTYRVGIDGTINYPVLGRIKLSGLRLNEAIRMLEEKVSSYVESPVINIDIISFQVSVMGEVLQPGVVKATTGRITILEAISAAGDMTIWGNRENVLLIRDHNGRLESAKINLTRSDIFSSPYFYLQQNDVIIVEPNSSKKKESKFGTAENYNLSIVSAVLSALSVFASVAAVIVAARN